MINQKKLVIVLPAYNAATTLEKTYAEIPHNIVDDIILVDDASRDDARYSIQIGIYGSQNNASKQVDSLIKQHLSGNYQAYQNQKEEARYRVRFGYFASYKSASRALEIWNNAHPDSRSYIVRLLR